MANITKKRHGELLQGIFRILKKHPNGLKGREVLNQLSNQITLTEYEKGDFKSGGRRFETIARFASVDTVRAGWLIKNSGIWAVTEEGIAALDKWPNPEDFFGEASRIYRKWHKERKEASTPTPDTSIEVLDDDDISQVVMFEQAQDQAREDITKYLEAMPPYDFQNLVGDLLDAMGYFVEWIAPPGKDGGIDLIAHTDPLGCQGPRIKVQVKRQQQPISLSDLKSFVANIDQLDAGIFVCTGGFTKDAGEYARTHPSRRVMLINMDKLITLWIEFKPKLSDNAWQSLPLTPVYFLTL